MNSKEILKDLIKINTINDNNNQEIMNYIENYLKKLGFKTEYRTKCLVMSNKNESALGFLGHTDTVKANADWTKNPFELRETDGNLYGLGVCDMKGGIATILSAVSKVDWSKTEKGIKLFFTYDEEIGFSGIKELVGNKVEFPQYMIFGEPTDNKVINASKGLLEFKINFLGISCHSSTPEKGVNAIENCVNFIKKIQGFYKILRKNDRLSQNVTMNIGIINGGKSINVVPSNCELYIDFRTTDLKQNIKIIKKIAEITSDFNAKYEIINNIRPFANLGEEINMSDFISEASFIEGNRYILGPGPVNAHIADEFITLESLNELEKQYLDIIKKCINNK